MKYPRFSIGRLMSVVGVVALNLWVGRILFSIEPWILAGAAPIGLTMEFAVYRLICSRGRARAFWAGFLATGLLTARSLVWGIYVPPRIGQHGDQRQSPARKVTILQNQGLASGSPGV